MRKYIIILELTVFVLIVGCSVVANEPYQTDKNNFTREVDFNFGWKFSLVEDSISITESISDFNDDNWKDIRLPHDWSVGFSFDSIRGEGNTGYLLGGTGWYRKHFDAIAKDKKVFILFDGIYNNAELWLNGSQLGNHPYGYSPFYYDITDQLNSNGKNNVLAVKVDRTRYADSRWYTGSGIYRNVKLITTEKLHIPVWGTFITTPKVSKDQASVVIDINLENENSDDKDFDLITEIIDPDGKKVAYQANNFSFSTNDQETFRQSFSLQSPKLWDLKNPSIYKAITTVSQNGNLKDRYETPFGIRKILFDTDKGFFLNGENMKIKGVCLHHDGGMVGAAVPKEVWRRRLQKLKDGGCNAVRISHNPGSDEFIELCDELGLLVQDEFFDEWDNPKDKRYNMNEKLSKDYITRGYTEHFQEWAERDLKNTMLAHRNHPSIIQWSIGNEIEWTYPRNGDATGFFNNMNWSGNYFWSQPPNNPEEIKKQLATLPKGEYDIGETAQKLSRWSKELDTTRYITANCILPSSSHLSGYSDALDVVGYSYRRVLYDYSHDLFPEKPIMGTENLGQWHEWKAVIDRDHISGMFIWTGIDYLGESSGGWPNKATGSGLLDLGGFEKEPYYMFKSLWLEKPQIHITTQNIEKSLNKVDEKTGFLVAKNPEKWERALWGWHDVNEHWNYADNQLISVEVYSNCEEVELFLNDKSQGIRRLAEFQDHIYKWAVPFRSGNLVAKGKKEGEKITTELITSGKPTSIELSLDKESLKANSYDVSHIVAQLIDADGNVVKSEDRLISFKIEGAVRLLGVDNGSKSNVQDFQTNKIVTSKGRALLIVQSTFDSSNVVVTVESPGLTGSAVQLNISDTEIVKIF